MKYIKLLEDHSEEQGEFLKQIGAVLGITGHEDELETLLNYAARSLGTDRDSIEVKEISAEQLARLTRGWQRLGSVDLAAFGHSGGVTGLEHGQKISRAQLAEINRRIEAEHPELFKKNGTFVSDRAFWHVQDLKRELTKDHRFAIATGSAGIFLMYMKGSSPKIPLV